MSFRPQKRLYILANLPQHIHIRQEIKNASKRATLPQDLPGRRIIEIIGPDQPRHQHVGETFHVRIANRLPHPKLRQQRRIWHPVRQVRLCLQIIEHAHQDIYLVGITNDPRQPVRPFRQPLRQRHMVMLVDGTKNGEAFILRTFRKPAAVPHDLHATAGVVETVMVTEMAIIQDLRKTPHIMEKPDRCCRCDIFLWPGHPLRNAHAQVPHPQGMMVFELEKGHGSGRRPCLMTKNLKPANQTVKNILLHAPMHNSGHSSLQAPQNHDRKEHHSSCRKEVTLTRQNLDSILAAHMAWLAGEGGKRADFSEMDLSGADLSRTHLKRANFFRTRLAGANLAGADLSESYLCEAILDDANLSGAALSGAMLMESSLRGTNLDDAEAIGADFSGACLDSARLDSCNCSEANFSGALLDHARLDHADLNKAKLISTHMTDASLEATNLTRANLYKAILDGSSMPRANFTAAMLIGSSLETSQLEHARLNEASLIGTSFRGARMARARLVGANLTRADFSEADLSGADFSSATCEKTNFTNARLEGTILPIPETGSPFAPLAWMASHLQTVLILVGLALGFALFTFYMKL
ncbi:MAG TPA: hypothetical protein DCW68_03830 [Rhodospirillaceae bacterium]|nr:hypothetical protein [Rhodospirillaceae bacterium]